MPGSLIIYTGECNIFDSIVRCWICNVALTSEEVFACFEQVKNRKAGEEEFHYDPYDFSHKACDDAFPGGTESQSVQLARELIMAKRHNPNRGKTPHTVGGGLKTIAHQQWLAEQERAEKQKVARIREELDAEFADRAARARKWAG